MVTVRMRRSDHCVSDEARELACEQAEVEAELGYLWRERRAVIVGVPVGEGLAVEAGGALDEGQADRGYDEHAEKRHLETGGEELAGIEDEQA